MAHFELDSFYGKFKNLLRAEKDAVLTLKSEAGRAFVTLSLDLGHVLSEPDPPPRGPRNGPARTRRREKRAAAREKQAVGEEVVDVEATENVEDTRINDNPDAEKASGIVKSRKGEEPVDTEEVEAQEKKETAEKAKEVTEEAAADRKVEVENIDDEFCTDDMYDFDSKESKSVGSQTLESGPLPNTPSKPGFDYFSLRYEDSD